MILGTSKKINKNKQIKKENWKYRCTLLSLTKSNIISEEKDTQSI